MIGNFSNILFHTWNKLLLICLVCACVSLNILSAQEKVPFKADLDLADNAYRLGEFDKTIQITTGILAKDAKNSNALYLKGSAEIEKGIRIRQLDLVRKGIEDSRAAISPTEKIEPNYYLPYLYGMSHLSQMENKPDHAEVSVKVATQVLDKADLDAEQRANILFQRGYAKMIISQMSEKPDFTGTQADYELALQSMPKHMGVLMALADAYLASNNEVKAKESFDRAIKEYPTNPLCYNNRGMYYQQSGKLSEAIADFTKALELDPKFYVAVTNRGFTLLQMNQYAKADQDFTASLGIEQNQPSVYSLRGTARLNMGKLDAAIVDYSKVTQMASKNPLSYADLGFALYFSKKFAEAAKAFETSISLDVAKDQNGNTVTGANLKYLVPWLYASKILAADPTAGSIPKEVLSKPAEQHDWPDMLVLFLSAKLKEDDLLREAQKAPPAPQDLPADQQAQFKEMQSRAIEDKTCEAYYFIGQRTANLGNAAKAKEYYQKAVEMKSLGLSAYRGAQYELGKF